MDFQRFYRNNKKLVWGMGALIVGSIVVYMFLKKRCVDTANALRAEIAAERANIERYKINQTQNELNGDMEAALRSRDHIVEASAEIRRNEVKLSELWC